MKTRIFILLALLASAFALWSCGDDEKDEIPYDDVDVPFAGTATVTVDFKGTPYPCGDFDINTVMTYRTDNSRALSIKPMDFNVTVPMMGAMQIATRDEIVFNTLKVTNKDGVEQIEGSFEGMVNTMMRGETMPMLMKCTINGTVDTREGHVPLAFTLNITDWGSMPFDMLLDFTGLKKM